MNGSDDKTTPVAGAVNETVAAPEILTVSPSPHVKAPDTSRTIMLDVCAALVPALVWACYIFGLRALTITLISVISCVVFEALFEFLMKRPITILDFSAVVTGILLAFNMPVTVPLWLPVIGSFFAIVIVKQLYGGIGMNVVNPALAARVFLMIAFPSIMSVYTNPLVRLSSSAMSVSPSADVVAGATALVSLKNGTLPSYSIIDMFLGNTPGVIGEVSALLLIAGGIYLIVRRVITWHIPVTFIATVAVISFIFPQAPGDTSFMAYELFSGGLMLGAIFMATDYTTSPLTKRARLIYGVGCGLITVFIRYFGGYCEGVSFAILIMNLTVYYLDRFTRPVRFGGALKNDKK